MRGQETSHIYSHQLIGTSDSAPARMALLFCCLAGRMPRILSRMRVSWDDGPHEGPGGASTDLVRKRIMGHDIMPESYICIVTDCQ